MKLATKLFLSSFLVSSLLFCGIYLYLASHSRKLEERRAAAAFNRTVVHYTSAQNERKRNLAQAAGLLARDFAFKEAVATGHDATIRSALESQKRRAGVDLIFLTDRQGRAKAQFGAKGMKELSELTDALAPFFADGELSDNPPPFLSLSGGLYQVTVTPVLAPSHVASLGLAFRLSGEQMDRLSDATGLRHLLIKDDGRSVETEGGFFTLAPREVATLAGLPPGQVERARLASGSFLVKALPTVASNGWRLLILFPLAESEQFSRELLEAFLYSGVVLLLLAGLVASRLAAGISRPFLALKERAERIAAAAGLEPPDNRGDEIQAIAEGYGDLGNRLVEELEARKLALDELNVYRSELETANSRLRTRLFQVKVMLSIWSPEATSKEVLEYLKGFLEVLLPGLPFRWGCVVIRPIAEVDADMIFAEVERAEEGGGKDAPDPGEPEHQTHWTSNVDPALKEFLVRESQAAMQGGGVTVNSVAAPIGKEKGARQLTVASLGLRRGEEPLGSLHLITENRSAKVNASLFEFLLNLANQVASQLQIHALSYSVRVDPLTRLYNRGYLNDRLREELVRSARTQSPFSFLLLDVDHFKKVNDTHGHQAGDEVLRGLAALLKRSCRGSDAVCRYGGEEIAILLADTPLSGAQIFAENVRKAVEKEEIAIPGGGRLRVTVSIGISEYGTHGKSADTLIASADSALYEAKRSGRNAWRVGKA